MALRVAVDGAGSSPPTISQPGLHRLVHQLERARPAQQAGLRKATSLDVDDVAIVVAGASSPLDAPHAVVGVDIDMAADMGRAHQRGLDGLAGRLPRKGSRSRRRLFRRSLSILSSSFGPTSLTYQGWPQRLLSRWVCASTRPGDGDLAAAILDRRRRPARRYPSPCGAMRPCLDQDVERRPGIGRTLRSRREAVMAGVSSGLFV